MNKFHFKVLALLWTGLLVDDFIELAVLGLGSATENLGPKLELDADWIDAWIAAAFIESFKMFFCWVIIILWSGVRWIFGLLANPLFGLPASVNTLVGVAAFGCVWT